MSPIDTPKNQLDILASAVSLPSRTVSASVILDREAERAKRQLGALSEPLRNRLLANLGIENVLCDTADQTRERGLDAAVRALASANLSGKDVGLVIDFTAFSADGTSLSGLGQTVQHALQATQASVLGIRGAGCCGFHVALKTAQAYFAAEPTLDFALLVAADQASDDGRLCLPVSIMADAASAMLVARPGLAPAKRIGVVRAVMTQTMGRFADVIRTDPGSRRISIDSATFEAQIVPLHFVVLKRLLNKALAAAEVSHAEIEAVVYPNTTDLDRLSVVRALEFEQRHLLGPGPRHLGHAFANDLLINGQGLFDSASAGTTVHSAWLAAGSGFSWGAAIIDAVHLC